MYRFEPPSPSRPGDPAEPDNPYATPTQSGQPAQWPGQLPPQPMNAWVLAGSPQHPRGTLALVLGILSIVVAPILGPFAWAISQRALREVDTSPTAVSNRGHLVAGQILGIIGTVFLVLGTLLMIVYGVVVVGILASG